MCVVLSLLLTLHRYVYLCLLYTTLHTLQEASGCGTKRAAETNDEDTPVAKQQCVESTSSSDAN
jgi:hypothetical protein